MAEGRIHQARHQATSGKREKANLLQASDHFLDISHRLVTQQQSRQQISAEDPLVFLEPLLHRLALTILEVLKNAYRFINIITMPVQA